MWGIIARLQPVNGHVTGRIPRVHTFVETASEEGQLLDLLSSDVAVRRNGSNLSLQPLQDVPVANEMEAAHSQMAEGDVGT